LIGYVLGALTAKETAELEERLREDPDLQRRLEIVRLAVRPLAGGSDLNTPPDLAARTCRMVREQDESSDA
jgi:anti-sigma-K factor RskA